jgi:type IX secretion system PorP/SprF family membrane protein
MVYGQQEQHFTQFMFNKMEFNPAEAGRHAKPTIILLHRDQWIGLEGSPKTQKLSGQMTFMDDRVGIGLSLNRHTVGITERLQAQLNYAYKIETDVALIHLGVATSLRRLQLDFTDSRLISSHGIDIDPNIERATFNDVYFNVGGGITISNDRFYFGIGVPRLRAVDITLSDELDLDYMENRHIYAMAGYEFEPGQGVQIIPQILLKATENAPINIDMNVNAHFNDQFLAGLTFRTYKSANDGIAESLDLLAGLHLNEFWLLALSYDIGLSALKSYHNGSMEIVLRYQIKLKERTFVNPRFF